MQKEPGVQVTALIVIACLFGGGGVAYGLANLVVQLAAIFLLALNGNTVWQVFRRSPSLLAVPLFASLALPLLQLVPLPPSVWTELPGRGLMTEALATVGPQGWRPATVSTAPTIVHTVTGWNPMGKKRSRSIEPRTCPVTRLTPRPSTPILLTVTV